MKILMTGGSGGIGRELITDLIKKNKIIVLARNKQKLSALKKIINNKNLSVIAVDVSKNEEVEKVFKSIDKLDALINTAGVLKPVGKFLDNDLKEWKQAIDINLLGSVYCCYYAMPLLLKARRGKIINFSGGGGAYGRAFHTAYASSKTAIVRFTECLAMEYPKLNINAIAPGAYKTTLWNDETHDDEPSKWGDIEHLRKFINFLLSKDSDGITGKFLHYKDDWKNLNGQNLKEFMFTLRRIDDYQFINKEL
ncbi:MAG: SDR family oxidoreductase [Patescibacteria group bacterium]